MPVRAALVIVAAVASAGCGGRADGGDPSTTAPVTGAPTTSTAPAPASTGMVLTPGLGASCRIELDSITEAMNLYQVTTGSYPAALADLAGPDGTLADPPDPARWSYTGGGPAGLAGIGPCSGVR